MDIQHITKKDIAKMSEQERKDYIRELLHAKGDLAIKAVFFNPQTKETVDLRELAEKVGEEEAIEIASKIFSVQDIQQETCTGEEVKEILEKVMRGEEISEREKIILDMLQSSFSGSDRSQYCENTTGVICTITEFAQNKIKYRPSVVDLLMVINMIINSSLMATEGLQSHNYLNNESTFLEICAQIGQDIYDTWKDSCTSEVAPEMIIPALLCLAAKIASENNIKLVDANIIAEALNIDMNVFSGIVSNHVVKESVDETENGSNKIIQPHIYEQSENNHEENDEDMRNMLKED